MKREISYNSVMKKHLLIILAAVMIVGCTDSASDADFKQSNLPSDATNVQMIGNDWITFNLIVEGRQRTFLYHGWHIGGNGGVEAITELNP